MSSLADLNKRLSAVGISLANVAELIGGPYPAPGAKTGAQEPGNANPSAVARLNDELHQAHGLITEVENTAMAIGRALGT